MGLLRLTLLVTMLALLLQPVARTQVALSAGGDLSHAMLHWERKNHHHHDDGSYHQDESTESAQHMVVDSASTTSALFEADLQLTADAPRLPPHSMRPRQVISATQGRLFRPPRQQA